MVESAIIISNNKMVIDKAGDRFQTIFVEGTVKDVLRTARDYIHKGHRLLTHPLAGSVKPNETPFKTVLISRSNGETIDMDSLMLIENSIITVEKFMKIKGTPKWPQHIIDDFSFIDFDLVRNIINKEV